LRYAHLLYDADRAFRETLKYRAGYDELPERGYEVRIWPARYPNAKDQAKYGSMLAPGIAEGLRELWHSRPRLRSATGGNHFVDHFDLRSNTPEGGCATSEMTVAYWEKALSVETIEVRTEP